MSLSAILLCGGESRRMGSDKPTLVWRGRPLWQHQLDTLRELGAETLLVSAKHDLFWRPGDVRLAIDEDDLRGPLAGIVAAFRACSSAHLIVLAIDLPFMTAGYLQSLVSHCRRGTGIVPQHYGRFEPLAAVYPREAAVHLANASTASLQPLIRNLIDRRLLKPLDVDAASDQLFQNLNTPADMLASR